MNIMKGKQIVITGATSGIGKEIALQLGAFGAALVLGCRNTERGNHVAEQITHNATVPSTIDVMQIDTSSVESIRQFARQYRKS